MKNNWTIVAAGFLLVLIGQVIGVQLDLYAGDFVWFDLLLHLISGAILAAVWIILSDTQVRTDSMLAFVFLAGSFALFGSFIWEVFELAINQTVPEVAADYSLRSSTVSDAIWDMFGGLTGGLVWGFLSFSKID